LKQNLLISSLCFLVISGLSISYAILNTTLRIGGQAKVETVEPVRVASVRPPEPQPSCGLSSYPPTWDSTSFQVDGVLPALNCSVVFDILVKNETDDTMYIKQIVEESFNNPTYMQYTFSLVPSTPDSVLQPHSEKAFTLTFQYKDGLASLPALDSFVASFHLVFEEVAPPILAVSNASRNFEIFRSESTFTPAVLNARVSALDEIDGDITAQIAQTCQQNSATVACPSAWLNWDAGDYTITYNVANSLGLTAVPVTMNLEIWKFIKIANGIYHGVALGSNGSVWTWGYNSVGQRGIGNTTEASSYRAPTQLAQSNFGGLRAIDVASAYYSSCAVNSAGAAYCWGEGASGVLGNGGTSNKSSPTAVTMPSGIGFTQISGSHGTSVAGTFGALGSDGNVYVWGNGGTYRLGTGSTSNSTTPAKITSSGDFVQAYQGNMGGAAINSAGQVYVWGANNHGQLALGNITAATATTSTPHLVSSLSDVTQVSYGGYGTYGFILALKSDGNVWVWGWLYGPNGSQGGNQTTPAQVAGISGVRFINAGADFEQYVVGNNLYSAGYANYGELFAGGAGTETTPTLSTIANIAGNVGMAAGGYDNAYVLSADGTTLWGIGFCDVRGQEFGSTVTQSTSTSVAIPWTINAPYKEW
jgi:alpha-tubulin suppressor-like RCC1 family protein